MKELSEKFGEKTSIMVILSIFTFGIYYFVWLSERRKEINKIAGAEIINNKMVISAALCAGLSIILQTIILAIDGDFPIDILFNSAYSILIIMIAWNIGRWLELYVAQEYKIDLKVNKILIILFNLLYINYLFNDLTNIEAKYNALRS